MDFGSIIEKAKEFIAKYGLIGGILLLVLFSLAGVILSIMLTKVVTFLWNLVRRPWNNYKKRTFKTCSTYIEFLNHETGNYYQWLFDNKSYIVDRNSLDQYKDSYDPIDIAKVESLASLSAAKEEKGALTGVTGVQIDKGKELMNITNLDLVNILKSFRRYNPKTQKHHFSESLYLAIQDKLKRRNLNIKIKTRVKNGLIERIPFHKLSNKDFGIQETKINIEIEL